MNTESAGRRSRESSGGRHEQRSESTRQPDTIRLVALSFDRVEFRLVDRAVSVRVGAGQTWEKAVVFPHLHDETGLSTGDPLLDELIRARAYEELIRLAAAIACYGESRAVA
jgi:hypothetical protein